jgi:biopolymer transport protein ExbD
VEVSLTPSAIIVNGDPLPFEKLGSRIASLLSGKERPEDRIVVVKSSKETPYQRWIQATGQIEKAGGLITLRLEEETTIKVD